MKLVACAVGVLALLVATPARAQEKSEGAWEVGARAGGLTADPFMDYFYDQHESVQGVMAGGWIARHSAGGNRVIIGTTYTQVEPKDGVWREAGEDTSSNEWTEFRSFKVFDVHVIVGKDWTFGPFGFFTGAGLGVAIPAGTITTFATAPPAFDSKVPGTGEKKNIPPAVPTIIVRVGPTVKLGPLITLYADAGLHNGLYAGAGAGFKF